MQRDARKGQPQEGSVSDSGPIYEDSGSAHANVPLFSEGQSEAECAIQATIDYDPVKEAGANQDCCDAALLTKGFPMIVQAETETRKDAVISKAAPHREKSPSSLVHDC